jgi:hypothetical protein
VNLNILRGGYWVEKELINRLLISKKFYYLAEKQLDSKTDISLHLIANFLQDSVEIFLLAIAYHLHADINPRTSFEGYFSAIEQKTESYEIPFKAQLFRLNKIRVNSKHYCILPQQSDCKELIHIVKGFFDEVLKKLLNVCFDKISLIDAIDDCESKNYLIEAEKNFIEGNIVQCAIECRKVLYVEFEKEYDISKFKEGKDITPFLKAFSPAPSYAKDSEYIEKNVKEPTDYIVLDYDHIEKQLLKYSIDHNVFWNVWRLTPELYRYDDGTWAIKHEFDKFDEKALTQNINYIYNSTVDIVLKVQEHKKEVRTKDTSLYYIDLNGEDIPVFKKADKRSEVVLIIPNNVRRVDTMYSIKGLEDDDTYYYIFIRIENETRIGFISSTNVE